MKTGLVSITFRALGIEEIVKLVSETKLDGIEWGGDVHVPHGDIRQAEYVGRVTRESGLAISAYGSYYRFDDCLDGGDKDGISMTSVLDTAEALGTSVVRVWAGKFGTGEASDKWRSKVIQRTREMADAAMGRGIRIGFEFHENTLADDSVATLQLLDEINRPNVFSYWQPYLSVPHKRSLDCLKALLNRVENVHCNHFAKEGWPHSLLLEQGETVWSDFLAVLQSDERERWISIEHVKDHDIENFRSDAATLKRWLGQ